MRTSGPDQLWAFPLVDPYSARTWLGPVDVREQPAGGTARTASSVAVALRGLLVARELDIPLPGGGHTGRRWVSLIGWARCDLALARLAQGHTDAVAVLAEAERPAEPGALYGVWAARLGGTGARWESGGGLSLHGTVRFCSGARALDRALVVAGLPASPEQTVLVEVAVRDPRVVVHAEFWRSAAAELADALGDLMIYIRQHHGERDHALLGQQVLAERGTR